MLQKVFEELYERFKREGRVQTWVSPDKLYGLILVPGQPHPGDVMFDAVNMIDLEGRYTWPRYIDPEKYGIKGKVLEAVRRGEVSLGALVNYDPVIQVIHERMKREGCELKRHEEEEDLSEEELLYDVQLGSTDEEDWTMEYVCGDVELAIHLRNVGDLILLGKSPEEIAEYFVEKLRELREL
ncbi:hypothetical protein DRO33_02570 [Candidatus Bathyarchaeota archaeon]|nr:MAG: hypothetical protein DRO33_02570 [Candidatus Bathyarchaeota archaeon]